MLTTHAVGLRLIKLVDESVQELESVIVMEDGNVITILEFVGILCEGYKLILYVVYS